MPVSSTMATDELMAAVLAGRKEKVRALLEAGGGGVWRGGVDGEGRTALHWACQHGHLGILSLLLAHCTPPCEPCAGCTSTPSGSLVGGRGGGGEGGGGGGGEGGGGGATNQPHSELVPNDSSDFNRMAGDDKQLVQLDTSELKKTDCDPKKFAPENQEFKRHCTCGRADVTTRAPDHVINHRDLKGQTALHVACNFRREDVASFLLTFPFCDIGIADAQGNTPLHRAIHASLPTLACLLVEAGADIHSANAQRRTPLHEAIRNHSHDVIRTLLKRGCDVNAMTCKSEVTTTTSPFLTAVFYYKISSRSAQLTRDLNHTLQLLVEGGCRLSEGDGLWTPLSAVVDVDQSFMASLLLFSGCRVLTGDLKSSPPAPGRSLLVEAFTRCDSCVVRLLVLCGYVPTVDEVDQCSRRIPAFSPLFHRIASAEQRAASRGKGQLLQWLWRRCAAPCSLAQTCRTAVRHALNTATGDTSILQAVSLLPLPVALKNYVRLQDFSEDFAEDMLL